MDAASVSRKGDSECNTVGDSVGICVVGGGDAVGLPPAGATAGASVLAFEPYNPSMK